MAPNNFRQLIRFCTDAYGLERLLRFFQSIVHIVAAFSPFLQMVISLSTHDFVTTAFIFGAVKQQLGLIRRFLRTFRFLDAFDSAYNLAQSQELGSMSIVMILDIMARTFNGMYLFLESATLIEAMGIEGLAVWSPEYEKFLKVESQRSWFLALVSGGLSCAVVLYKDRAERVSLAVHLETESVKKTEKSESSSSTPEEKDASKEEKIRKRMADLDRRKVALTRKLTANCLDLALPGSVIGWVPASSGTVGLCMFVTSLLTGWDVWERCGREVRGVA